MDIERIFANNKRWVSEKLSQDPDYFAKLNEGQKPKLLYIGCSDSRVTAEELMGVGPGDAFILRNIANMVSPLDMSAIAVINYAVTHLEVKHVVVCGHYQCGGVKAAMDAKDLGLLNPWLRHIRDVFRMHKQELLAIPDAESRYNRLIELNVQEQCTNVLKIVDVQRAIRDRGLTVHGWIFDIVSGKLVDLKIDFHQLLSEIREIYQIE